MEHQIARDSGISARQPILFRAGSFPAAANRGATRCVRKIVGGHGRSMNRNPVLDLPLSAIFRAEIALPLQQLLRLGTVGALLESWRHPRQRKSIEQLFDSPGQARQAVTVCAAWLGFESRPLSHPLPAWWREEDKSVVSAGVMGAES
jgi:hypothetical protein